ncbi:MAG: TonB-dependent receptor [Vicinamibacterales bacterium]
MKYTSTISNKLLLDAGYGSNVNITVQNMQAGIEHARGSQGWYANAARFDRDLSTAWAATNNIPTFVPTKYLFQTSASYVTGSHAFKAGVQYQHGWFETRQDANADLEQDYRTGVPDSVVIRNTPFRFRDTMNYDIGFYVQDTWTIKRLTLNGGLRVEKLKAENTALTSPAGRFAPERSFPTTPNLPNWTDLAPRFGMVYDLFGTGRTALKFSPTGTTTRAPPASRRRTTRSRRPRPGSTWRDLNGDDIAQGELGCVYLSTNCEINFSQLPSNFGVRSLRTYDPATERPYNVMSNISVQHQLLRNVSVTAAVVNNRFYKLPLRDNLLRSRADYTPVTIYSPIDGAPITVYNLAASKVTQVQELDTTASSDRKQLFTGYEFTMNSRLPGGATIFGGTSIDRNLTVQCDEPDNPNLDSVLRSARDRRPLSSAVQAGWKLSATVVRHPAWRHAPELSRRGDGHDDAAVWHHVAHHADDALCGELPGRVHPWSARVPDAQRSIADRSAAPLRHRVPRSAHAARFCEARRSSGSAGIAWRRSLKCSTC